ncbi:SDR family NAD(P)-dependent oxidoreductase [Nocardia sp. NPDC050378]|uniref:SDR family NAD(P)-dependent oxidoreductase n=1 Tax=Nocardia sp. NPDC050378 TaxID=3155400 RepID=UPI0033DB9085
MPSFPLSPGRFDGRRALVTGGANGLGLACAERLAAEGAAVGIIDLDPDTVAAAAKQLTADGHRVDGYAADVSDYDRIQQVVTEFHGSHGSIDILVTMAGIYPAAAFAEMTPALWRKVIDVNLTGTFNCVHTVLPYMKDQQYGRIVTVSSGTVMIGPPDLAHYVASKAGIVGLTRSVARDAGPDGVTANVVLPGLINTERAVQLQGEEMFDMVLQGQSIPRRGEPGDIADAVAYLASEGAGFVTGQSLYSGGGDRFV